MKLESQNRLLEAQPTKHEATERDARIFEVADQTHISSVMAANNVQARAVGGANASLEDLFTKNGVFTREKDALVAEGSDITIKLDGRKFTSADFDTVRTQAQKLNQKGAYLHLFDLSVEDEQRIRAMKLPNVTAHSTQHSHDAFASKEETPEEPVKTEKKTEMAA